MIFSLRRPSILPLTLAALISAAGCEDDNDDETDASTQGDGGGNTNGTGGPDGDGGMTDGGMDGGSLDAGEGMDGGSDNGGDAGDPDAATLTDGQIAAVVTVANMGEIEQANAALMKVQNQAVRDFAMMMVTMHSAAQARAMNVAASAGIAPQPNEVSMTVKDSSEDILSKIEAASMTEVDLVYMREQVSIHMRLLTTIDDLLLPSVSSAALRTELQTTRGEVMSHLAMAEAIVDMLE
jgi:putative membrane protein